MRLVGIRPENFRSFGGNTSKLMLHEGLTVLVGPNEAGKTSLLEAAQRLSTGFKTIDPRSGAAGQVASVKFWLELSVNDKNKTLSETGHTVESVRVTRTWGEAAVDEWGFEPECPERAPADLEGAIDALNEVSDRIGIDTAGIVEDLRTYWRLVAPTSGQTLELTAALNAFHEFAERTTHNAEDGSDLRAGLAPAVAALLELARSESPFHQLVQNVKGRLPAVLVFDQTHRGLKDSYLLSDVDGSQPLRNLLDLAKVDLSALGELPGHRAEAIQAANQRLQSEFTMLWGAERPYPKVTIDRDRIAIYTADPSHLDQNGLPHSYRSAGVQSMIELVCFVGAARSATGAASFLLLADEIEQGLHYDAQVGLMSWLDKGIPGVQIMATTHSIGCWPPDIATQMNSLVRLNGKSQVHNGPYGGQTAGATGLLEMMGASRANFSINRPVVFCEGAIDEMLLPFILRPLAGGLHEANFIGSLSQSSGKRQPNYPALPSEAFLVDYDDGAEQKKKNLVAGDPAREGKILDLNFGLPDWPSRTVEDLIEPDRYAQAFEQWFTDQGLAKFSIDHEKPLMPQLETGLTPLGTISQTAKSLMSSLKRSVADRLVQDGREGTAIYRTSLVAQLTDLAEKLEALLSKQ